MKSFFKKRLYASLLLFLCLLVLTGFAINSYYPNKIASNTNIKSNEVSNQFAIVLVKGVKTGDAMKLRIEDLQLETQPLLTDKDLILYKWEEHELELRKDFDFGVLGNVPVDGLPYVVIANDKRIYLGAFWTSLSSLTSSLPLTIFPYMSPQNIIKIGVGYPDGSYGKSDPRSNQLIYDALKIVGKIK